MKKITATILCTFTFVTILCASDARSTTINYSLNDSLQAVSDHTFYFPAFFYAKSSYFPVSWGMDVENFIYITDIDAHKDTVFILDSGLGWIQAFDLLGNFKFKLDVTEFLRQPSREMVIDNNSNIFIGETYADDQRIIKLSEQGNFILDWPVNAPFSHIEIDEKDNIYVAAIPGIDQYSSEGEFIAHYPIPLSSSSNLFKVDTEQHFYVADNNVVKKFDKDGILIWKSNEVSQPVSIEIGNNGNIFILDRASHKVWQLTSAGVIQNVWGKYGNGPGELNQPNSMTISENGNLIISNKGNRLVQKFSTDGSFLTGWGEKDIGNIVSPNGITLDINGDIYVTSGSNILKFSPFGSLLLKFNGSGVSQGRMDFATGIAVDDNGNIYIADTNNHRIQKFNKNGLFIKEWGSFGHEAGNFKFPLDVAADNKNYIYIADALNARIQKFDSDGNFIAQWTTLAPNGNHPSGLAIDSERGVVYVLIDYFDIFGFVTSCCVAALDLDGNLLYHWVEPESNTSYHRGISIGKDETLYISIPHEDTIKMVSALDGSILNEWKGFSDAIGEFDAPIGIASDKMGNIYVADSSNHRIQKLTANYPLLKSSSGLILNGSFENQLTFTWWTFGGTLPILASSLTTDGKVAARLGEPVAQTGQNASSAWLYQTIYVEPEMENPTLSFNYRMHVNDTIDFSDFRVQITEIDGTILETILRDGFRTCSDLQPLAGTDMGWRNKSFSLASYQDRYIRIRFENRNLHSGSSLGIWTDIDNVSVVDTGSIPTINLPIQSYWPLAASFSCDGP